MADLDVVVAGAGFAGIYAVHAFRSAGLTVRAFEAGSGVGGTWFWNRYPGRALRCRVQGLLILLLPRARAGLVVERAVPGPARGAQVPEPCGRPVRAAALYPAQHASSGGPVGLRGRRVGRDHRRRGDGDGAVLRVGGGVPVGVSGAVPAGPAGVRGPLVSHQPVAGRGRGLHGPAGRSRGHRIHRDPGRAGDRRGSRAPDRVPADGELRGAEQERAARRRLGTVVQGVVPGVPGKRRGTCSSASPSPEPGGRRWPSRRASGSEPTWTGGRPAAGCRCWAPTPT